MTRRPTDPAPRGKESRGRPRRTRAGREDPLRTTLGRGLPRASVHDLRASGRDPGDSGAAGRSLGERALRFLAAIAFLCALAAFPASDLFALHTVTVAGNRVVPSEEIVSRSGLVRGESVFRVNAHEVRLRLRRDPRIEDVSVAAAPSGTVQITVRERLPVAALRTPDGYVDLGPDAVAIARVPGPGPYPWLAVSRLDPAWVQVGTVVPSDDVRAGVLAAGLLPEALRPLVAGLRVDAGGEVALALRDGVEVRVGTADRIAERLRQAPEVLAAVRARGGRVDYVDLRFPGSVIVKPAGAAGPRTP